MTRAAVASLATAAATLAMVPASAPAVTVAVTTGSPQDVSTSAATFRATVLLSALGGGVTWQYGPTTDYGTTTRAVPTALLGLQQDVTLPVGGLAAGTTYHVRAVALSGLTTSYGRDVAFGTQRPSGSGSGSGSSGSGSSGSGSSGSSGSGSSGSGSPGSTGSGSSGSSGSGSNGSGSGSSTSASPTNSNDKSKDDDKSSDDDSPSGGDGASSDDGSGATTAPGAATADVTPVLGRTIAIAAVAGRVVATSPTGALLDLSAAKVVPTGTLIDTRAGTVELTSALDTKGTTQTGRFWGGIFEVRQGTAARGLTQLVLRGGDFSSCAATTARTRARAHAAKAVTKKKAPARSLWGSDHNGRFETRGRGSVATVRGTRWQTQDTCAGTRTTVTAGAVAVRDLGRGRTVVVTKGHNYLARVAP
ncbi:hypothetical protein DSM104299_01223 [Baekduia alba]|uniref:hypothetical protein n=1 Tax=Baekduia alba TaxID=2997333 RepID=UPI00234049A2|nr:hypothetical protein [Baekduia alba]WCB92527.1 hypothetical protein DSM104299_01223 [Baekduia alba]